MKFNIEQAREVEEQRRPIIRSFLDLDHYKLTMNQFAFHRYPNVLVRYASKNRTTKVRLAEIIDEKDLRRELDAAQALKPTNQEMVYLRTLKNNGQPLFKEDYLEFLENIQLSDYDLKVKDGQYLTEFPDTWPEAMPWETFDLSIKNELYYRALMKNMTPEEREAVYAEGQRRLERKIALFNKYPGLRFMEFATRRRFSGLWQEHCIKELSDKLEHNQMIGTSNVYLAMKYGLVPKGTMAHEVFMFMSGVMHENDDAIRASHNQVLQEWWDEYGVDLSIALTDTYGSDFFFKDMTEKQARDYIGLRQDSGNPDRFANRQIQFYQEREIEPKKKAFVPSDGLDEQKMVHLYNVFGDRIPTVAGYGTNLGNDLGFGALSNVVKLVMANGYGTVKLSDNPEKAMGDPKDIQRFMRIFEYDVNKYVAEECKY
jgi:nicotinate phosphoribosyltransferase